MKALLVGHMYTSAALILNWEFANLSPVGFTLSITNIDIGKILGRQQVDLIPMYMRALKYVNYTWIIGVQVATG